MRLQPKQLVVDSNCLQTEKLREFLSKSTCNMVALTDYAAMEAYKGDTLTSLPKSMSVLMKFPHQVAVLRPTGIVCGLGGRAAGLRRRLIDQRQTREFHKWCDNLRQARTGQPEILEHLQRLGKTADNQMLRIEEDAAALPEIMAAMTKEFSPTELAVLRKRQPISDALNEKLMRSVIMLAYTFFKGHPNTTYRPPRIKTMGNTFFYRLAVVSHMWFLRWLKDGACTTLPPSKIRNDVIDLNFVTFATFLTAFLPTIRSCWIYTS